MNLVGNHLTMRLLMSWMSANILMVSLVRQEPTVKKIMKTLTLKKPGPLITTIRMFPSFENLETNLTAPPFKTLAIKIPKIRKTVKMSTLYVLSLSNRLIWKSLDFHHSRNPHMEHLMALIHSVVSETTQARTPSKISEPI